MNILKDSMMMSMVCNIPHADVIYKAQGIRTTSKVL